MGMPVPTLPARSFWAEVIHWIDPAKEMPDHELIVLLFVPDYAEPVWPGWHDGESWCFADGSSFEGPVVAWAEMPIGRRPE